MKPKKSTNVGRNVNIACLKGNTRHNQLPVICIQFKKRYSRPLSNMGLKCTSPLIHRFFSVVNTTVVHDPWVVESVNVELWIGRNRGYRGLTMSFMQI